MQANDMQFLQSNDMQFWTNELLSSKFIYNYFIYLQIIATFYFWLCWCSATYSLMRHREKFEVSDSFSRTPLAARTVR